MEIECKSKLSSLMLGKSSKLMFEIRALYIAQTGLKFKLLISASGMIGFRTCSRFLLLVLTCLQFILVTTPFGLLSFLFF